MGVPGNAADRTSRFSGRPDLSVCYFCLILRSEKQRQKQDKQTRCMNLGVSFIESLNLLKLASIIVNFVWYRRNTVQSQLLPVHEVN